MRRLENKSIVVTGAAGALGSAMAERAASEGAQVLVADIRFDVASQVAARSGSGASAFELDIYQEDSIAAMIAAVMDRHGAIDVLINAAADTSLCFDDRSVLDISTELWDKTFAADARSYFLATRYALPHMLAAGKGSIVHVASGAGLAGDTILTAYGSAKAAVVNFSRYVAAQYGPQGVRSNSICPGIVPTPTTPPALLATAMAAASSHRQGQPDDIAAVAAFLAADESAFINGTNVTCDGGMYGVVSHWHAKGSLG